MSSKIRHWLMWRLIHLALWIGEEEQRPVLNLQVIRRIHKEGQ